MTSPGYESCEIIEDGEGTWSVDWGLIWALVRSHEFCKAVWYNGRAKKTDQTDWYNPFSWSMPDVVSYEINWKAVYKQQNEKSKSHMKRIYDRMRRCNSMREQREWLRCTVKETADYQRQYRQEANAAQKKTMANINEAVSDYKTYAAGAKIVRDISAETVLVGATFMSGGAAAGLIAAGSGLKGVATYQDTGNVGAALMETAGSVVFTAIPVGARHAKAFRSMTRAQAIATEGTLILVEAQFETAKGLISGDTVSQALAKGGLKVVTGTATGRAVGWAEGLKPVQKLLNKTGVPANIKLYRWSDATIARSEVVSGLTSAMVNQQAVGRAVEPHIKALGAKKKKAVQQTVQRGPSRRQCLGSDQLCGQLRMVDHAVRKVAGNMSYNVGYPED